MKKRKFSMLLNIAVLCLCVAAIAFGVYSAKQASLNVNGTIGFNAHNCNADITIKTNGDSIDANGNRVEDGINARTNADILQVAVKTGDTIGVYGDKTEVRGADLELALKPFYFCDMTTDGNIQDITLTFEITNQSDYAIVAQISSISATNNVKFYISNGTTLFSDSSAEKIILETKGETNTITIICKYTAEVDFNSNLRIVLSLSKKTVTPINFSMSTTNTDILDKFKHMTTTSFTANENETWSEYICRMGYICDWNGEKNISGEYVRYDIGHSEGCYIFLFTKNTKNSTKSLLSFTAGDIDGIEKVFIYFENVDNVLKTFWVRNGSNKVVANTDKIVEGANYTF